VSHLEVALTPAELHLCSTRPGRRVYLAATVVLAGAVRTVCRQLGDTSIASKRRYNDDAIVHGCTFEHYAAAFAWIKRHRSSRAARLNPTCFWSTGADQGLCGHWRRLDHAARLKTLCEMWRATFSARKTPARIC